MLHRPQVEPFAPVRAGRVAVRWLPPAPATVRLLDRLCRLVRRLEGRPRAVVAEALRRQEKRVRDARRLSGVAKVLLDAGEFRAPEGAERAEAVRAALFEARARRWPPVPGDRDRPYEDAAAALGTTAAEVERLLYADLPAARVLARAPALDGRALLDRYNLELARGVLLDATRVTVAATGGWRDVFRAVKLARLMYRVRREGDGYAVELTGPAAPFVVRAERYGARLARVLPAVARAPGWRLEAEVVRGGATVLFSLDGSAPFGSPARAARYDSAWERALADAFEEKAAGGRDGWTLHREATPVAVGESLFLPDFTLRHDDGREALVELVGFWTPEYLEDKLRKVAAAGLRNLVLVAYRGLAAGGGWRDPDAPVVWFAQRPRIGPVLAAAERIALRPDRR
jgi:uncharacterized protein